MIRAPLDGSSEGGESTCDGRLSRYFIAPSRFSSMSRSAG